MAPQESNVSDSILDSVKTTLGIDLTVTEFDEELKLYINSVLASVVQMGIGPKNGYSITDNTATWSNFIGKEDSRYNMLKTYVALKVKSMFDPSTNKTVTDSVNSVVSEYEYRLKIQKEVIESD